MCIALCRRLEVTDEADTNEDNISVLIPHEMGSSDDESEVAMEPVEEASLGQLALDLWNSRSKTCIMIMPLLGGL